MGEVSLRPICEDDINELVAAMRDADRAEVLAMGTSEAEVIVDSIARSSHAFAAEVDGDLIALWGVGPQTLLGGVGVPWLLTTNHLWRHRRAFIRACRRYLPLIRREFPRLVNLVDARYQAAIDWLRLLGFTVHEDSPALVNGVPFYRFEIGG